MSRKVRRGWRYFVCEVCGLEWKEACRDHETQSSSLCPRVSCEGRVNGGETPHHSEEDASLKVDFAGNLIEHKTVLIGGYE